MGSLRGKLSSSKNLRKSTKKDETLPAVSVISAPDVEEVETVSLSAAAGVRVAADERVPSPIESIANSIQEAAKEDCSFTSGMTFPSFDMSNAPSIAEISQGFRDLADEAVKMLKAKEDAYAAAQLKFQETIAEIPHFEKINRDLAVMVFDLPPEEAKAEKPTEKKPTDESILGAAEDVDDIVSGKPAPSDVSATPSVAESFAASVSPSIAESVARITWTALRRTYCHGRRESAKGISSVFGARMEPIIGGIQEVAEKDRSVVSDMPTHVEFDTSATMSFAESENKSTKSARSLKSLLSRKSNKSSESPVEKTQTEAHAVSPIEDTEAAAEVPEAEKSTEEAGADEAQVASEEEQSASEERAPPLQAEEPEAENSSEEAGADEEQSAAEERAPSPTESIAKSVQETSSVGSGEPAPISDASVSLSLAESVARSMDVAEELSNLVVGPCLGRSPAVVRCEKPEVEECEKPEAEESAEESKDESAQDVPEEDSAPAEVKAEEIEEER